MANKLKIIKRYWIIVELLLYFFISLLFYLEDAIKFFIPRTLKRQIIKGKLVLITGGAQGLGQLTSKKLAMRGAIVIVWDIDEEGLKQTKKEIEDAGGVCHTYVVNVTDSKAVAETAKLVKKEHGKVKILVNNAGIVKVKDILKDPEESITAEFNINVISHFWLLREFLPDMKAENDGHVVSVSSMAGKFPFPGHPVYCATKAAVCGLDETLRMELDLEGCDKVYTTLVLPYFTNTKMSKDINVRVHPTLDARYVSNEIVDGILMKSRWVVIPDTFRLMIALRGLGHHKMEVTVAKACIGDNYTQFARFGSSYSKAD